MKSTRESNLLAYQQDPANHINATNLVYSGDFCCDFKSPRVQTTADSNRRGIGSLNGRFEIAVKSNLIKSTEELELLGVVIDRDLSFTEHISASGKKASMRVGVLMRMRKLIPVEAKLRTGAEGSIL